MLPGTADPRAPQPVRTAPGSCQPACPARVFWFVVVVTARRGLLPRRAPLLRGGTRTRGCGQDDAVFGEPAVPGGACQERCGAPPGRRADGHDGGRSVAVPE